MGFLANSEDSTNPVDAELDTQINQDKADLERKKQNLFETRLSLEKNRGEQQWTPDKPSMGAPAQPQDNTAANAKKLSKDILF